MTIAITRFRLHAAGLVILSAVTLSPLAAPALSQEGVIASVYERERSLLKKMWKARQDGNQVEVGRLSNELKAFVAERKSWAAGFLTLTTNSIAELEGSGASGLDPAERARLEERRRVIAAEIDILELQLENARLEFYRANRADRLEIERVKELAVRIKEAARREIAVNEGRIAEEEALLPRIQAALDAYVADKKKRIEEEKALIPRIRECGQKYIAARQKEISEYEATISRIETDGLKAIEELRKSARQVASPESRKELEAQAAELAALVSRGDYSSPAQYHRSVNSVKGDIENRKGLANQVKADLSTGDFAPAEVYYRSIKSCEESIVTLQKLIDDAVRLHGAGDFAPPEVYYRTGRSVRDAVSSHRKRIAEIRGLVESGEYAPAELYYTSIRSCTDIASQRDEALLARREQFTSEAWQYMGDRRRQIQALELEAAAIDSKTGSSDGKVKALQARKTEIERFLAHDFVTELPAEESGFMKAIKWCSDAASEVMKVADKVRETTEKFKRVRQIVDIVKTASNPAQAADRFLKAATGKGFVETIGEKLLPEKVLGNPIVRSLLRGESVDRAALMESAARDGLPKEVTDAYDTLTRLREDPEGFLRSNMLEKVMNVIEGNPSLKKTYETMQEARRVMENPELLEEKLEANAEAYAKAKERLERIRTESLERVGNFENNVAAGVSRAIQNAVEHRLGITDDEKGFAESLVEGYEFGSGEEE